MITTRQDKVRKTLKRHNDRLAKLQSGELNAKYQKECASDWEYWMKCDIEQALDDIRRTEKKLAEAIRLDAKEDEKMAKANAKKNALDNLPQNLKAWMSETIEWMFRDGIDYAEKWLEDNNDYFDMMDNLFKNDYAKYREIRHTPKHETMVRHRDICSRRLYDTEKFHKECVDYINALVLDLQARIEEKCGDLVDFTTLILSEKGINGFVKGTKGSAEVRTIGAGGYNIQQFHYRVLVL